MSKTKEDAAAFRVYSTTMVSAAAVNPAPYNAQKMTAAEFESLKSGIRKFGFVESIVVQRDSPKHGPMILIGGHQRIKAVKEICIEENKRLPDLPAIILDVDDRAAKMLNIALNKVHGSPDPQLLGELLEDIHSMQAIVPEEIHLLGFEDEEFSKLLRLSDPPPVTVAEDPPIFGRSVTLSLEFKDVSQRDAVKKKLVELSEAKKQTTGQVVFGLLGKRPKR